jgi:hypothetical protein
MSTERNVADYYSSGNLLQRLNAALIEDGFDSAHPQLEALAPYDRFHGRGLEATEEIATKLKVTSQEHLLDVGGGIGGPHAHLHAASVAGSRASI